MIKHLILLKINGDLLQWLINFLIKKTLGGTVKNENISNKKLTEELQKTIIKKNSKEEKYTHPL